MYNSTDHGDDIWLCTRQGNSYWFLHWLLRTMQWTEVPAVSSWWQMHLVFVVSPSCRILYAFFFELADAFQLVAQSGVAIRTILSVPETKRMWCDEGSWDSVSVRDFTSTSNLFDSFRTLPYSFCDFLGLICALLNFQDLHSQIS